MMKEFYEKIDELNREQREYLLNDDELGELIDSQDWDRANVRVDILLS